MVLESHMMLPVLFSNPPIFPFNSLVNADVSVMCYIHLHVYAVTSDDFPELEIVGCPASYDHLSEMYIVDFQWRVPFSPAALSHIELLAIHVDKLLRLSDDFNDFSPLQLGLKPHKVYVNVRYF